MSYINGVRFADVAVMKSGDGGILLINQVAVLRIGGDCTVQSDELGDALHQTISVQCDGRADWLRDLSFLDAMHPSIEGVVYLRHSPIAVRPNAEAPASRMWTEEVRTFGRSNVRTAPQGPSTGVPHVPQTQLEQALSLNRYYSQFLAWDDDDGEPQTGWEPRLGGVMQALNLPGGADERAFADAVRGWQIAKGGLLCDGIIGKNTWARLEPLTRDAPSMLAGPAAFRETAPGAWPSFQAVAGYSPMRIPGRGFFFVVVDMLPDVGAQYLVRKVGVIPQDFILRPTNPLARLSPAEHALGTPSQWISASNRPFGAPTMNGRPVLMDVDAITREGGTLVPEAELIKDLERFARENPAATNRVNRLIKAIQKVEGETLVTGPTPRGAVRPITGTHAAYVREAEALFAKFQARGITQAELEAGLNAFNRSYRGARIIGRVGRVFTVVGVVMTAVDMGFAIDKSVQQQSFRPVAAETIRQVGGWGGAIAGAKLGAMAGAAVGIETGPGAIVTGAVGAIIFGAIGYFSADWLADQISEN